MSVSAISNGSAALGLMPPASVAAPAPPAKDPSTANDNPPLQTAQPTVASATSVNKISPAKKQTAPDSIKSQNSTGRMSHVVEVYSPQGKKRLKFMDSNNRLIYQVPTELAAKMEDLMTKSDTSTSKKG